MFNYQLVKSKRHRKAPLVSYPIVTEALSEINIDLIGPLPEGRGYQYIFTVCDRFIKACFAFALLLQKVTQNCYIFFKSLYWNFWCAKSSMLHILLFILGLNF